MKWLLAYILALVALQLMFGNINVEFFSFPIGLVLGVAGIALLYVAHREFGGGRFITHFRSARMAYVLLALVACCCVAGGAVPAFARFTTSVPFVGLLVALLAHLALVMMHRLRKFSLGRDGAFACVHLGIWLALFSGMAGAADTARLHALLAVGEDVSTAYDENGCELPLRHTMRLQRFAVERNPANNTVVQFRAWLLVDDEPCELAVNSPHSVGRGIDNAVTGADGKKHLPISISTNQGKTWTYHASPFPPIQGHQRLVLLRLQEGPIMLVSFTDHPTRTPRNLQGMMFTDAHGNTTRGYGAYVALSYDEGRTWPVCRLLTDGTERHLNGGAWTQFFVMDATHAEPRGYLAATQSPDGMIHLLSSRIHYAFNLAWIEAK